MYACGVLSGEKQMHVYKKICANLPIRGSPRVYKGDEFRGSEGGSDGDPQGILVQNKGSCESEVAKT